jgi:hypothetical protein
MPNAASRLAVLVTLAWTASSVTGTELQTLCLCVDTFVNFQQRANQAYLDDVADRMAKEQALGPTTRDALEAVWQNVKSGHAAENAAALLEQQADICDVRIASSS